MAQQAMQPDFNPLNEQGGHPKVVLWPLQACRGMDTPSPMHTQMNDVF